MIIKNWVYYMQRGLQSMWKSKSTPEYRDAIIYGNSNDDGLKNKKYTSVTDEVTFNSEGVVHKNHPFTDREFDGAFKECGCLPDCGCKE